MVSGAIVAQEKARPKDSVRVSIPGCTKGYVFTAARRTQDEPGTAGIPEGMHLRMNGRRDDGEIKRRRFEDRGHRPHEEGQFGPDGVSVGGGVRISPGPPSSGGINPFRCPARSRLTSGLASDRGRLSFAIGEAATDDCYAARDVAPLRISPGTERSSEAASTRNRRVHHAFRPMTACSSPVRTASMPIGRPIVARANDARGVAQEDDIRRRVFDGCRPELMSSATRRRWKTDGQCDSRARRRR
jgi:hypothetical protein